MKVSAKTPQKELLQRQNGQTTNNKQFRTIKMSQHHPSRAELADILEAMIEHSQGNVLAFFRVLRKGLVEHVLKEGFELDVQQWYDQQSIEGHQTIILDILEFHQLFDLDDINKRAWEIGQHLEREIRWALDDTEQQVGAIPQESVQPYQAFLIQNKALSKEWLNVIGGMVHAVIKLNHKADDSKGAFISEAMQQELLFLGMASKAIALNKVKFFYLLEPEHQTSFQKYLHQKNNERNAKQRQLQRNQFIQQDFQDYDEVYKALS